ncbi:MAG: DUF3261 domain-containing protein [Candidatus Tectomicrobia bacterium]|nr:DUF3261 domain-containing protein [Candidatus Tectomicrobia bacterium]
MKPLLILALILLSSCAWLQRPAKPPTSSPTYYPLQSPGSYGATFTAQNLLQGEYAGRRMQFRTYVEIDPDQIVVLGLTPWQTRAFVLRYDGQKLDFENFTHREMPFPPALILSDLQQVLWPALPSTAQWRVEDDVHPRERRVYFRNQLITRIQYAGQSAAQSDVTLRNLPYGYQLNIRTLHRPRE